MFSSGQNKISLAPSTNISLNDRFTKFAKIKTNVSDQAKSQKALNFSNQLASAKNRRLVLQMANRPSVQAALKLKKRSIKQRIGLNKNRLGNRLESNTITKRLQNRPINRNRLGFKNNGIDPSRLSINNKPFNRRSLNLRLNRNNQNSIRRNKNKFNKNNGIQKRNNITNGFKRFKISGDNRREINQNQRIKTRIFRNRNFLNKNRKNGGNKPNAAKLNNDLDNYMSKRANPMNF